MALRINDVVPNLDLVTDQGEFKLHDFIGDSWTILFSHHSIPIAECRMGDRIRNCRSNAKASVGSNILNKGLK